VMNGDADGPAVVRDTGVPLSVGQAPGEGHEGPGALLETLGKSVGVQGRAAGWRVHER
jgi:hypothetical protein